MSQPAEHLRAVEAAFRAGRPAEAETAARAALKSAPADPGVQHVGGMALLRLGRLQDALAPLGRAAGAENAPVSWVVALGNAQAMAGQAAEAEATFRRVLAREPANAVVLLNLGILLSGRGALEEAEKAIEASLAARPGHPGALIALGNVRTQAGDTLGAVVAYREAVAAKPDFAEAQANLGGALADLGQAAEAEATLRRALALNSGLGLARHRLGDLLIGLGRMEEAQAALRQVVTQDPRAAAAWNSLGLALRALGRMADAANAFRSAIAAKPDLAQAHANLALLLAWLDEPATEAAARAVALAPGDDHAHLAAAVAAAARGDVPAAQAASRQAVRLRPFVHIPARGAAEATVLVLQALEDGHFQPAPGGAKLPEGHNNAVEHLDPARFARVDLYVDALAEDPGLLDRLPRCDVAYNAITEPEGMRRSLALAATALEKLGLPVINAPASVPQAARDLAPALFAGIEGLVIPRVLRVTAAPDTAAAVRAAMAEAGVDFPVIARPAGTHTGQGMVLLRAEAELAALPASTDLFITEFVDFRDADGLWRKTRLLCVGGRVLPEHWATADDWNIHHRNSRAYMRAHPEEQAREIDYLEHFEKRFGVPRLIAVGEMADRLGLDFFGIDAALLPDDRLVVFEANPSMRAMFAEAREGFEYLLPGIGRISAAFCDLVLRRARRG
ncbi:tetratricopeptide repeat protein [Roseomonas eburnea]|uniref:Tetratricopeptide repeat protein n=1 Tax=Neoroseomonas eburnea TaxID=1346889 RepID=A0A9X9XDK3_9PROT|nr:tetratricopeptide repeat protein [Neoroseomonas eburnea]